MTIFLSVIRLIPVNATRWFSELIRRNFAGYTHHGSLVFLNTPQNILDEQGIPFRDLVVKKSPDIFWRVTIVLKRLVSSRFKAAASDHSMDQYSQKLLAHARRRNRGEAGQNLPSEPEKTATEPDPETEISGSEEESS